MIKKIINFLSEQHGDNTLPERENQAFSYREGEPAFNKFRAARIWSNGELMQFSNLFMGTICNVSGAGDADKEGRYYRNYFINSSKYLITNLHKDEQTDFVLDLEVELHKDLVGICDCVFNHTVLEHVYECRRGFANLCTISRDVVIVVVPYIQQIHGGGYKDFWRFTPDTMQHMYDENGLKLRYCSANGAERTSIYLFCIGYRDPKWDKQIPERMDISLEPTQPLYGSDFMNVIGGNVIK